MSEITRQDNATLETLITALEAAHLELQNCRNAWQEAHSSAIFHDDPIVAEAGYNVDLALEACRQAESDLAQHTAAFWRAGYRLCRDAGRGSRD